MLKRSAIIVGDYRYQLQRIWDDTLPRLVVCMLNPSTADAERDDPTLLTLIHFGKLWGYGGLIVVNLFALRSPSPAFMMAHSNPFGVENGLHLADAMNYARMYSAGKLLVAWGNDGDFQDRAEWFCSRAFHVYGLTLLCLGTTRTWKPKHPMARGKHRIPRDQQPIIYRDSPEVLRQA